MSDALFRLNQLAVNVAVEKLAHCCGATRWVHGMVSQRPFRDVEQLQQKADQIWWALEPKDWREAFTHHPQIGDLESLRTKFADTQRWAGKEQASVQHASDDVLMGLAEGNAAYQEKFGYIFIVCATGKSAAEMLALLQARLPNAPKDELPIAAEEQRKITQIRLQKLLTELGTSR